MTNEQRLELTRLIRKFCNDDGWTVHFQSTRIPLNEGGEVYADKDADFGYSNRIILEPPEIETENFENIWDR